MAAQPTLPDQHDIDAVLDWCVKAERHSRTAYPGLSYEQGVEAAIRWLLGQWERPDRG